jgi:dolichol-phosphate mannosyltransferase
MKTAVIIPTYNERENITEMIKSVSKVFSENSIDGTIIIVDDNSPDKTWEIAGRLAREYPVEVLRRTEDRGYGKSTLAGFKKAIKENYEIIFTMDCDFSHEPKIIPFMIKKILEGNHVAVGSRRIKGGKIIGWNAWRHFCSFGAMTFSKIMLGLKTKDITSGF